MKKQILALTCAVALLTTGNGTCLKVEAAKKPISLSKKNISVEVGQTKKLNVKKTAKVKIKSKTFTSSNKKVAIVTKKTGKIKAKKAGKATITVKVKYIKKTNKKKTVALKCKVTVTGSNDNRDASRSNETTASNQSTPGSGMTENSMPMETHGSVTSVPKPTTPVVSQNPESSARPTEEPTPEPSVPVLAEKNDNDVAVLKMLIAEQNGLGAEVSEDLDSEEYEWDAEGYLVSILWSGKELIGNISFSSLSHLKELDCSYNSIKNIDISDNKELKYLNCNGNKLKDLDISSNVQLEHLDCGNNKLTALDLSNNIALEFVNCVLNNLKSLDVSNNSTLYDLEYDDGVNVVGYALTTDKNRGDVVALKTLIAAQKKKGAKVSEELDSEQYEWNEEGDLISILWNNKSISGKIEIYDKFFHLQKLDVSGNTALESLEWSHCSFYYEEGDTRMLDTSGNTALTNINCSRIYLSILDISGSNALMSLDCSDNHISSLDLKEKIALKSLNCENNNLSNLNLKYNVSLKELDCSSNALDNLDISNNTVLERLYCSNNQLSGLDTSKNKKLIRLWCYRNRLTDLEVSNNELLYYLICDEEVNITGYQYLGKKQEDVVALKELIEEQNKLGAIVSDDLDSKEYEWDEEGNLISIQWNNKLLRDELSINRYDGEFEYLSKLDISNNPALISLDCQGCGLNGLNIDGDTGLTYIDCSDNNLSVLNVSSNTALTQLECDDELTIIGNYMGKDIRDVLALKSLIAEQKGYGATISEDIDSDEYEWDSNGYLVNIRWSNSSLKKFLEISKLKHLKTIDVSNNPTLRGLESGGTELNSLNVDKCTALRSLYVMNCHLSYLDISSNTNLIYLRCDGNELTSLNVTYNLELESLECYQNEINKLDITNNLNLKWLNCSNNSLNSLDISKNVALTNLYCDSNSLSSLDVRNNIALEWLECTENRLQSLDVSQNRKLSALYCSYNQLSNLDVSHNKELMWLYCSHNQLSVLDISNNTELWGYSVDKNVVVIGNSDD